MHLIACASPPHVDLPTITHSPGSALPSVHALAANLTAAAAGNQTIYTGTTTAGLLVHDLTLALWFAGAAAAILLTAALLHPYTRSKAGTGAPHEGPKPQ